MSARRPAQPTGEAKGFGAGAGRQGDEPASGEAAQATDVDSDPIRSERERRTLGKQWTVAELPAAMLAVRREAVA